MWKRIIERLFGAKLPCGHYRFRAKQGERITCPQCSSVYTRAKIDWPYVDECLSDMKIFVDKGEELDRNLIDKLADQKFISFLEYSANKLNAD